MKGWSLRDVELATREAPDSFFIPKLDERRSQKPGDQVKLHFLLENPGEDEPGAERMWVEIRQPLSEGHYVGILTNHPQHIRHLAQMDEVVFEPRHIAEVMIRQDDPRHVKRSDQKALVSKMAFDDGEILRFAYREKTDRPEDSGWRFFTGHEDDEYTEESENIRFCNVGWLLGFEPTLDPFIREPDGAAFEREAKDEPWRRVTDWSPPQD